MGVGGFFDEFGFLGLYNLFDRFDFFKLRNRFFDRLGIVDNLNRVVLGEGIERIERRIRNRPVRRWAFKKSSDRRGVKIQRLKRIRQPCFKGFESVGRA